MSGSGSAKGGSTAAVVTKLVKPIVEEKGCSLWDVRFVKEGAEWYLRIFIDKPEGITLDDCEAVSRAIDGPLDELDPIEQSYFLEVSSPGTERELTRPEHFEAMAGQDVRLNLFRPVDGQKEIIARLVGLRDKQIVLEDADGNEFEIARKDVVSVKLMCEY